MGSSASRAIFESVLDKSRICSNCSHVACVRQPGEEAMVSLSAWRGGWRLSSGENGEKATKERPVKRDQRKETRERRPKETSSK